MKTTGPSAANDRHQSSVIRIAVIYFVVGILWICLSDLTLATSGGFTAAGFLTSIWKGSLFVLLSTGLVYWLCRREYRELKRATDLLRTVIEGTSDAVFVKDIHGRYLFANAAAANVMHRSVAEVLGRDDREFFTAAEAERLMQNDRAIMNGRVVVTLEETLTSSGAAITFLATKAPYFDSKGAVSGLIGISRNITERKQVELTLRETEERLREAQRIARIGSWAWHPQTDHVWWSEAEFELMGVDPKNTQPGLEAFLRLLHPDDRATAIARVEAMKAGADEFANDLRILRPDGRLMWICSQARATRDAGGKIVRVEGIDQDITVQRLTQEAARENERTLQAAVEVAGLGIIVIDYDKQIADLSMRAAEQFGFLSGSSVTRTELHSRFHPADSKELFKLIDEAVDPEGAGCFAMEHRVIRPDGSIRWLSVRKQVSFQEDRPYRAVLVTADITDRKQAEVRIREQEMLVREAAELAKVGGWGFDPITLQSDWTPAVASMYGLPPDAPPMLEKAFEFFNPEQRPALQAAIAAAVRDGVKHDMELQLTGADGEKRWVRTICRPIVENGHVIRVRGSLQDITEQRQLQEQFRQAQKMEAVGRLAGGVAHDFNNLLTVINGYAELMLMVLTADDPMRGHLNAIRDAGDRAARLTEQLLAFSRKSMVEPRLVDLNELVLKSARLFRRLIGEDIALTVLTESAPLRVVIDPGQLEQVLMNLAVNARDAMPTGGRLTIETRLTELNSNIDNVNASLPPGTYASLLVTDTGSGMSAEVREKIFEPFFTTKGVGQGTGLGLAVVHGIVQQSGGAVTVESEVGTGTKFEILLPTAEDEVRDVAKSEPPMLASGKELVLVVEDEDAVRNFVRFVLEGHGYQVIAAASGQEAIDMLRENPRHVDLLVTDVIMPELSGYQLALTLREEQPNLRVLYMSGYTDDALDRHGLQGTTDQFIQKPFTPLDLAQKVRLVLD